MHLINRSLTFLLALFTTPAMLFAANVTIRWTPNTETDLSGYNAYYGTSTRSYGTPLPVGNATLYTFENLEEETRYFFALTAVDTSGNESGFSSEVSFLTAGTADTTPPHVTITSPTSVDTYSISSSQIQLSGSASDNQNVAEVTWSSSGGTAGAASGTESWSIVDLPLQEGANIITVTAFDASDNSAQDTITVTYNPPDTAAPQVAITVPVSSGTYSTDNPAVTLGGTASDERSLDRVSWSSSSGAAGTTSGIESWSIVDLPLQDGINTITVTAFDAAGNSAQDTITVTYVNPAEFDDIPPELDIRSPTTKSKYHSRRTTVDIGGRADDNQEVAKVIWRNSEGKSGTCQGTESWTAEGIPLDRWWNTISVTAFDSSGNKTTRNLLVFRWK